jgi:CBS domain-containing protein
MGARTDVRPGRGADDEANERKEARMRVRDLMTTNVLSIGPEAPLRDVAAVLVEHRISGLPVCDIEGHVLGVLSEGDILYKEHDPREAHIGGPLGWIVEGAPNHVGYAKAAAMTVGKAMTAPAVTIGPAATVAEAARLMSERRVNRLPVVDDERRLVGIVTRADLVRAFVRADEEIAGEIREDVLERTLWAEPGQVDVEVRRGTVTLSGALDRRSDVELLERLVRRVPGVVAVASSVSWRVDDRTRRGRGEPAPAR